MTDRPPCYERVQRERGYIYGHWEMPDGTTVKHFEPGARFVKRERVCRCGCGRVPTGRRHNWFSQACVDGWLMRTSPSFVRQKVLERDRGICARCGLDAEYLRTVINEMRGTCRRYSHWSDSGEVNTWLRGTGRDFLNEHGLESGRALWEAHHQVAVAEGGGLCGLDGYETLCRWCHQRETKALVSRLAEKKRRERACDGRMSNGNLWCSDGKTCPACRPPQQNHVNPRQYHRHAGR